MNAKIIIFAAVLAVVCSQDHHGHGYSSQSIVHHEITRQDYKEPSYKHEEYKEPSHKEYVNYKPLFTPVTERIIPVVENVEPVVSHAVPVVPVVQHIAPVVHHVAPLVHHVAPVVHVAPVIQKITPIVQKKESHGQEQHEENYGPAKYEFSYHVEDKHTGDIKSQHEIRDGYAVKGEYSLHQPDGLIRIVKYNADKTTGFNADVLYSGHSQHIENKH